MKEYLSITLKIWNNSKTLLYEELAQAFTGIKLHGHHLQNSPAPFKPQILKKGPWPTIAGSHREMDTLLSIFPLLILKTNNSDQVFNSPPYQLIKIMRKISFLLGKKGLTINEMEDIKKYWEVLFDNRLALTDQYQAETVVKKPKARGNQRRNTHTATIFSQRESSQVSQEEPIPSQGSPLLFGDSQDQVDLPAQDVEALATERPVEAAVNEVGEESEVEDKGDDVPEEHVDEDNDEEADHANPDIPGGDRSERYYPPITPKEHFFIHLLEQMKNFGPASRSLSTQAYEQKHQV